MPHEPEPDRGATAPPELDSDALALRLGGRARGGPRRVRRLSELPREAGAELPADALGDAVVVAFDRRGAAAALAAAPAVLVHGAGPGAAPDEDRGDTAVIEVEDPRRALATLTALFDRRPPPAAGVHPSAVVHPEAVLGPGVSVGPLCVIGPAVRVGRGSVIGPHCSLADGSVVGADCLLYAGVRLYDGVRLGDRVRLHAGVVIGADGFGYAPGPGGAEKIHHLGGAEIGDDVEIGANTAVDRGTLSPTRIGARTKIDNHCQIGHNVVVGHDCLIAGMTAIGGSTRLGDGVLVGGSVAIADHLEIGDGARIAGASGVGKRIPAGEVWAGAPAVPYRHWVRGLYLQGRLERIWAYVRPREAGGERHSDDNAGGEGVAPDGKR